MAEELGLGEPAMPNTWAEAEERLNARYGGEAQARFELGEEPRIVDNLTENLVAQEAKFGPQALSEQVEQEIAKDLELLSEGRVSGMEWHFFENPARGGGASAPLLEKLIDAGFDVIYHFSVP